MIRGLRHMADREVERTDLLIVRMKRSYGCLQTADGSIQ